MNPSALSEQDQASLSGPRDMKTPGELAWCWQTISALQSMWKNLDLDYWRYQRIWTEAEEQRIWEMVPPGNPYGSKEAMLERLQVGDEEAARARVALNAIPARPLNPTGTNQYAGPHRRKGSTRADYLTARIARDHPDIWERMKAGEFKSVAEAAREAGISYKESGRVRLGNPMAVVDSLYKIPGNMVSSDSDDNDLLYVRDSYGDHIGLRQLTFGGLCIAIGSEAQLDKVEAAHRRLHSWLVGHELIQQIREVYLSYQELVNKSESGY